MKSRQDEFDVDYHLAMPNMAEATHDYDPESPSDIDGRIVNLDSLFDLTKNRIPNLELLKQAENHPVFPFFVHSINDKFYAIPVRGDKSRAVYLGRTPDKVYKKMMSYSKNCYKYAKKWGIKEILKLWISSTYSYLGFGTVSDKLRF